MKMVIAAAATVAGLVASASGQTQNPVYTFELRLIADGDAGAPVGAWPALNNSSNATALGFWLQARVSQTGGQNYGIARAASPVLPGASSITITSNALATLERGLIGGGTERGRGTGFRFSNGTRAAWDTPTGNAPDGGAFPSASHNDNGAFDQSNTRIYGFDAYIGPSRTAIDANNPYGAPLAPTGEFSPWQNLYRFVVINNVTSETTANISATAQLTGTLGAVQLGEFNWVMRTGSSQVMTATYSLNLVPAPAAACLPMVAGLAAFRRRRSA